MLARGDAEELSPKISMPAGSKSLAARGFAKRRRIREDLLPRHRLDEVAQNAGQPPTGLGSPRPTASERMNVLGERALSCLCE